MKLSSLLPFFLLALAACQASTDKNMADSDIYFSIAKEYIAAGETAKGLEQVDKAINANEANFQRTSLKPKPWPWPADTTKRSRRWRTAGNCCRRKNCTKKSTGLGWSITT